MYTSAFNSSTFALSTWPTLIHTKQNPNFSYYYSYSFQRNPQFSPKIFERFQIDFRISNPSLFLLCFPKEIAERRLMMVAEADFICQPSISMLDVKYHLCVAQEHSVKVEVSPKSPTPSLPIFGHVRVCSYSIFLYYSFPYFSIEILFG